MAADLSHLLSVDAKKHKYEKTVKVFKFRFQMVWYSNGHCVCFVLCTSPTIRIPDQYVEKTQDVIQMVRLSGIQMAFEDWTIWNLTSFHHLNTKLA